MTLADKIRKYLKNQWNESLAYSIWVDLTPFGRITIWVPIWLFCWITLPLIFIIGYPMFLIAMLLQKMKFKLPPVFFK